ncbi:MAG: ParB/RepB/Spo0J family partition protein [Planctomycetes bacterium]|nr:ParB/RepB/Spo0J family partition protein [Planctomycetota bacterium]
MTAHNDPTKVRKLGRGLSALLQTPVAVEVARVPAIVEAPKEIEQAVSAPVAVGESGDGVRHIAVEFIVPSPFQPRRVFEEAPLRALADSIRTAGVMQPIIVRRGSGGAFELVAGERRWRAAKLAGLARVPSIVRELGDEDAAEWALIENVQREDLNAMDRAHALRTMSERFGLSHARIAEKVGLERATVANLVRLTELEPEVAELVSGGGLSAAHGKALLSMSAGSERIELAREAARHEWSVRKVEAEIKRRAEPLVRAASGAALVPAAGVVGDARRAVVVDLERRLSQQLGTKVFIQATGPKGDKGKISIEFYGLDHFEGLMEKLGLR